MGVLCRHPEVVVGGGDGGCLEANDVFGVILLPSKPVGFLFVCSLYQHKDPHLTEKSTHKILWTILTFEGACPGVR